MSIIEQLRKGPDVGLDERLRRAVVELADRPQFTTLETPFDAAPMSILPRLTTDQKVELRTVAPMVLAGARSAVGTITTIAAMQPRGVFEACALSACSSFASLASSLALIGAAVALAVCNDGEEPPERDTHARVGSTRSARIEEGSVSK